MIEGALRVGVCALEQLDDLRSAFEFLGFGFAHFWVLFGVRRQSEATTALWIKYYLSFVTVSIGARRLLRKGIQSAVVASPCRRTPNQPFSLPVSIKPRIVQSPMNDKSG